jgi:uncharacterized linocin/CFP29 family protein
VNNLHRELAPISDAAWTQIEAEARRTFIGTVAARRVVDVVGPGGTALSAVGTGHLRPVVSPADSVIANLREVAPLVELRVPFTVSRAAVDDVERGAADSDWQPVKDAARSIALAEDRAVIHGFAAAGIGGIEPGGSNPALSLPAAVQAIPRTVAQAIETLRQAGVAGPYNLLLSADTYTAVAAGSDEGYPVQEHIEQLLADGQIIWAPALAGGLLISARGGDYQLHLGQDLSIGYLSHDGQRVELYLQESLTFLALTAEASVHLPAGG